LFQTLFLFGQSGCRLPRSIRRTDRMDDARASSRHVDLLVIPSGTRYIGTLRDASHGL